MTDIAAAMAQQPVLLAACVGVVGLLLFMLLTRKSYGPVPKNLKSFDKISGPSGLPIIGSLLSFAAFRPKAHLLWSEWAAKYGAIYQYTVLGRTFVVVSDPKVLPAVLDSSNFVKSPLGGDGGLSEEAHTGLAPAFGAEGAKAQYETAQKQAMELASKIDKGGPDTGNEMQAALEEVMLDVLLTAAFDATPSKLEVAGPPLLACLRAASRAAARPISDPVGALFGASSVVKAAAKAAADAALADLVKGLRRRGPAAKSDTSLSAALSRLSSAGGAQLSDAELAAQVSALAANAVEPTAQSIAWALFAVATQPALQDGIAKELREAGMLAHGEDREPALPSHADLEKLPYLMSVIKESQRLFPAAAIGPLRYAASNTELAGYFIPKGTHIQVPLHTLHTSAANWPSPERFWPERWAPDQATRGGPKNGGPTSGPGSAFMPFGSACISARAAELQVAAVVGALASRFKISLGSAGGRKAALERQTLDSVLRLDGGMKLIFVPRASIGFSSRI